MKKFLLIALTLSIFSLSAQQNREVYPQPKYPELFKTLGTPIMPSDPEWVREMYSATPNFYKIVRLHDEYYRTHLLKKTTHTQNYKHFYRKVSQNHYYDDKGNIVIEDIREDNSNRPKNSMYANRTTYANGEWTPVAPLETFDENGKRKSAHVNTYAIAQSESNPNIMYMGTETGAVFKSVDKAENWFEVGKYDFYGGTAQAIKIDPKDENIVYVAYDKKFFRTTDGGQTWKLLIHDNKWKMDVEVHPTEDIVYLAGNCGLLRSTDKGETWQTIIQYVKNGDKEDGRVSDIEFKANDPSTVFVAVSNATVNRFEVWKSTDNGLTFSPKTNGWYQPTNPNRKPNMGIAGAQGAKIATTKADPNRVYVLLLGSDVSYKEDLNFIGVFRSDNAGESWSMPYDGNNDGQPDNNYGGPYSNSHWAMSTFNVAGGAYDQGFYNADIDASDTNPDVFLVGMLNLFKSTNGGKSYIRYGGYQCDVCNDGRYRHPDIQDILIQGSNAWVASDGGVDKYDANLNFVDAKNKGVSTCDLWGFDQGWNEDVLVGGRYHDGNMAYHENYQNGRTLSLGGGESGTGFVNQGENRKVYHDDIGGRLIPKTLPGVLKGIPNLAKYPSSSGGSLKTSEIVNDPRYWNRIYMGKDNKFWKSEDYGRNFTLLHTFGSQGNTVRGIEISREDPKLLFVVHHLGSSVKLWKTTDAGQSWSEVTIPHTNWAYTLSLSDDNELFIAYDTADNNDKIYKSTDLGASWQNLTSNVLSGHRILDVEAQGGTDGGVYAITKNRVFYKNNSMDWQPYSEGIPNNFKLLNAKIFYKKGKLRLAGNRGVWERDLYEPSKPIAQPMVGQWETSCERDKIQFEDYSMLNHTGATWKWEFPGSASVSDVNARNPIVTYSQSGNYDVKLTVTQNGQTSTKTVKKMITVNESNCNPSDFAGKMAHIEGENQYLSKEFATSQRVSYFTFTGWIKPKGVQPDYSSILFARGKDRSITLDFKNGKNELGTHSGGKWNWSSGLIVPKDKWSYVAVIYTPNKVTVILNEKKAELTGNFPAVNIDYIDFGIHGKRNDRRYRGDLDEVTLWHRALSIDEIRLQRHLTKKEYNSANLWAYYQFNDILGGAVYDVKKGNDLKVVGGVTLKKSTCPVGKGVSQKKTMNNNSLTNFDIPKVKIATRDKPFNGDVVISRLEVNPFVQPTADFPLNEEYYIINNYGQNQEVGKVSVLEFTDIEGLGSLDKTKINLYHRERNSDENNWVNRNNPASISGKVVRYNDVWLNKETPSLNGSTNTWWHSAGQFYLKSTKKKDDCSTFKAPTIKKNPASCTAKASAKITNYDTTITYTISPNTATLNGATITGMEYKTNYTLTATKNNCTKDVIINISNADLDCDQDGVKKGQDSNDNDACVPNSVAVPTIKKNPASCTAKASAEISNYDATITYEIEPNTARINGANITGMEYKTNYTLTATKNNCTENIVINISNDDLDCDQDGVAKGQDDDDANACIPNATDVPQIAKNPASCTAKASATISNYNANVNYSIQPLATLNGANITGMEYNIDYVITAEKNHCEKTAIINISNSNLGCADDNDKDGVKKKDDPNDNDACVPKNTPQPIITKNAPSCDKKASAKIANYDTTITYSINPQATINGAEISGMNYDTDYTLTATRNNCTKTAVINISDDSLDCNDDKDKDGVKKKDDADDTNACVPKNTPEPIITKNAPSCDKKASAKIVNYDTTIAYSINPQATINGAEISGMNYDTDYTLTATRNNCTKTVVINISDDSLDCNNSVEKHEIILYPNPMKIGQGFAFKGISAGSILRVYDMVGKLILVKKVSEDEKIMNISYKGVGVYIYSIETKDRIKTGKFIIK